VITSRGKILLNRRPSSFFYDGASYLTKAVPSGLDFNDAEMIADSNDRTFESTVGNWTGHGNHAITRDTSFHHSGVASGKIVLSGSGDSTSNYVSLDFSRFGALTAGKLYSLYLYCRDASAGLNFSMTVGDQTSSLFVLPTGFGAKTFTFLATPSTINQPIKIYGASATTFWIDDVSLTPAYDAVFMCLVRNQVQSDNIGRFVFVVGDNVSNSLERFNITQQGSTTAPWSCAGSFQDSSSSVRSYANVNAGNLFGGNPKLQFICVIIARELDFAQAFTDGIGGNQVSSLGSGVGIVAGAQILNLGYKGNSGSTSTYWSDLISHVALFKLSGGMPSDIANTIAAINSSWRRNGLPRVIAGTRASFYSDPSSGYLDLSENGNHLSLGAGSIVRVRV